MKQVLLQWKIHKGNSDLLYFLLFHAALTYYLIDSGIFMLAGQGPMGLHFIRQTDGLSFISRYYMDNMPLLSPATLNLDSIDGRAASEFPIFYWLCAKLYHLTGERDYLLRIIYLVIFYLGSFHLFRLITLLLKDRLIALGMNLIFLSSTIILYYGANYLPDVPAMMFVFCGWYYFVKYIQQNKKPDLYLSLFFFTFAGLMKLTAGFNLVAAIIIFVYQYRKQIRIFPALAMALSLAILASWLLYVRWYNQHYGQGYFLFSYKAIWDISGTRIKEIFHFILDNWAIRYYRPNTWIVFAVLIGTGVLTFKKENLKSLLPYLLIFAGGVAYLLLYFQQFNDHDYYFITFIPALLALVTGAVILLFERFPRLRNSTFVKIAFMLLTFFICQETAKDTKWRIFSYRDKFELVAKKIEAYKTEINSKLKKEDLLVIAPHFSPSGGLYYLRRKGFTMPELVPQADGIFQRYLDRGANAFLLTEPMDLPEFLKTRLGEELFRGDGLVLYRLR